MRAAIFDMDGTLTDTEVLWVEATRDYLRHRGFAIADEEVLRIVYGHSWRQVYAELLARFPLGVTRETMEADLRARIAALQTERASVIIHGSVALLKRLAQRVPVCIVSGAPCADIARGIEQMGIAPYLRFYIGAEHYPTGKPDPTCFLMARERLAVPAADCVVFEDSSAGVRAAKAAGMCCIALARPGRPPQDLSLADRVVADLAEVDPAAL